ncbi:LuxR C-terminal-related transcriptional regulator [Leifsonia sp. F6_8S_P_1B]|uniref:LuxR C-terminal-related transcriptional regulator n=1 Tax=Leifsonia williamsii TaxID=3035919 RepID=A0ABT8K6M3_9MICO|nr:LuxR family transcriptional regulator [Leifsonia williamsii]MDN4613095.1 LuxR C-terminal-related transcriptional regulator [Leifsonia williamsii]
MAVHGAAVDAALQRLDAGFDVVVTGDAGSGRSRVLAELSRRAHDAGRPALLVRPRRAAKEVPFSAMHGVPGFLAEVEPRPGAADVFAWLTRTLDGPRPLVLLDDVQETDRASLGLLLAVAQTVGARVAAVVSGGQEVSLASRDLGLTASLVEVPPLGIRGMGELLGEHTGGTVEAGLVAELTTASGGNPLIALLLFEAGVRAGSVRREAGVWSGSGVTEVSEPAELLAVFLAHLPEDRAYALRLLAWCGAVPLLSARRLVGAETLRALAAAGRVVTAAADDDRTVVVSPPALSRALLARLNPVDRAAIADDVEARLGEDAAEATAVVDADPVWWQTVGELDPPDPRLPVAITLLTERLRSRIAALRREWLTERDVTRALPLLRILMVTIGDEVRLSEVFAATELRPGDTAEDVAAYVVLRHQWQLATGREEEAAALVPAGWDAGGWGPAIGQAVDGLLRPLRAGVPLGQVLGSQPADVPPTLRNTVQLLRAEAALEEGRTADAEELAHAVTSAHAPADLLDRLAATRADALLLSGRVTEAIAWSRAQLAEGFDRGDPFTVKIHARGLATAQLAAGDEQGAWRALSAALRVGRPGPISAALDERVLGLAAVLSARRGDLRGAQSFAAELRRLNPLVRPRLDIMAEWSEAELRYAADAADTGAGDLLWEAGLRQRDRGAVLPALLCWLHIAAPLPPERLAELGDAWSRVDASLLQPAVRLHRALAAGDAARVLRALAHHRARGPLERAALRTAAERWLDETGAALTGNDVERVAGAAVAERWREFAAETPDRPAPLTDREREVLELAKDGLSNRQIAEALFLSLRTVENHLYRVRQKTGITRAELTPETTVRA